MLKRGAEDGGRAAVKVSYTAGKETAKRTYQDLQKRTGAKRGKKEMDFSSSQPPEDAVEKGRALAKERAGKDAVKKNAQKRSVEHQAEKSAAAQDTGKTGKSQFIRTRESAGRTVKEHASRQPPKVKTADRLAVKKGPRIIKSQALAGSKAGKIPAPPGKMQAAKAAKRAAIHNMQQGARRAERVASAVVRFKRAVEACL